MRYAFTIILLTVLAVPAHAGYRELFEKEFMRTPWAIVKWEGSACIGCHTADTMEERFRDIPAQWKKSWHYKNNVSCHDCHGGDQEDATMAMSHQRGFVGVPTYGEVPEFCGKCHLRILDKYQDSGHGIALRTDNSGPNCVTCHGSHDIQQANIDIINETLCSQCHTYERAKLMKQALFLVESRLDDVRAQLDALKGAGVLVDKEEKAFFNTHVEFRALFHSVDVDLVKAKTDIYNERLDRIEGDISEIHKALDFRRNFAAFLFLLFLSMAGILMLLIRQR